jgi:hypothetical protein
MKMYNFYTLVLAISHAQAPTAIFAQDFPRKMGWALEVRQPVKTLVTVR